MKTVHAISGRPHAAPAFTLVEVLICALLLVLGFIALVAAFGHDTVITQRGEEVALGTFLADEVQTQAYQMTLANVIALDGITYNPAMLSTGATGDYNQWSQHISVTPVSATDLNAQVAPGGAQAARMTVEVRLRGKQVVTQTYYAFDMQGVPFTDSGG